jgi:hypothetical protein
LFASSLAAVAIAAPSQAEEGTLAVGTMAELTQSGTVVAEEPTDAIAAPTGLEMTTVVTETATPISAAQTLDEYLAGDAGVSTSADSFLTETAVETAQVQEDADVAQVSRPLYRGVAPFYLGVGGNLGIIDSSQSAVGDFGFNIISKISLGPRFSLRPMFQFSEGESNMTLPLTYNFNPVNLGGFSLYPAAGAGVDFGGFFSDISFLLNAGVDVPISRDFTLNSQVNWRVTESTGLGISFGVGYNFPLFFE